MLELSAPKRGLKPATAYAQNETNRFCIAERYTGRTFRQRAACRIHLEDRGQYDNDRIVSNPGRGRQGSWGRTSAGAEWQKRHGTARQW